MSTRHWSNLSEIETFFNEVKLSRIALLQEKAAQAVTVWRDAFYQQYLDLSDSDGWAGLESLAYQEINGAPATVMNASDPLETPASLWIKTGTLIHAFEAKYVTKYDFSDAVTINRLVQMAVLHAKKLKSGLYKDLLPENLQAATWDDYLALVNGKRTQSDLDAQLNKMDEERKDVSKVAQDAVQAAGSQNYTVTKNDSDISGRAKSRGRWWSINHNAGDVYLIADLPGANTIYRRKNAIKTTFNARFWDFSANPVAGFDFDRPAWIVPSSVDVKEIYRVIDNA